jgi:MinD-like ATPase involved in chromosome partitioning or flagellar assembly
MFTAKSQLDDKVIGFEAGADDYLTKPTHPTELQAHVKALLARSSKNKVNPPTGPVEQPAYAIGVLAARGGLGVTSVAANLAASLQKKTSVNVILAEFRPGRGTLCFDLNLAKASGLTELLNTQPTDIKRSLVSDKLIRHPSGVDILAASSQPKDAVLLNNIQQFEVILNRLEFMTRYVVIDLGNGLDLLSQKLAPIFNELLVIVEPLENSIQHTRALLDDLVSLGVDKSHLHVAVNYRIRSDTQLSVPQVQDLIKFPIDVTFTPAPELLNQASRMQTMACLVHEEGLTTQQYNLLATKIDARAPKSAQK